MYAVIFRAKIADLDEEYVRVAERMRKLALEQYGCIEFASIAKDGMEIAVSYWDTEEQIIRWKNHPEHLLAQKLGRSRWYESYDVEIVEVLRKYGGRN